MHNKLYFNRYLISRYSFLRRKNKLGKQAIRSNSNLINKSRDDN